MASPAPSANPTPADTASSIPSPSPASTPPPFRRPPPPLPRVPSRHRGTLPLLLLVGACFAFPFVYITHHNRQEGERRRGHYLNKEAMPPAAAIRGAYLNSGSKDVGYDDEYYKKHGQVVKGLAEAQRGRRGGDGTS